jgi:hypothetical protein
MEWPGLIRLVGEMDVVQVLTKRRSELATLLTRAQNT